MSATIPRCPSSFSVEASDGGTVSEVTLFVIHDVVRRMASMVSCGQSSLHAKRLWLVARMAPDLIRGKSGMKCRPGFRASRLSGLRTLIDVPGSSPGPALFPIGDVVKLDLRGP
jgi:hypothetical protein